MTKRIFRSICLVAIAVLLASLVLIMGVLYTYFNQIQQEQLRTETALAAQGVTNEGDAYFDGLDPGDCRITWIAADGTVLYDSSTDSEAMENHLQREEVREALLNGYGESSRYSATLHADSMYAAQRLPDGTVLRLSISRSSVLTLVLGMSQPICVVLAVAIVLSLVLAYRLSKRIVQPLNEMDLDDPLSGSEYEELSPLLRRIDSQQRQLKSQARELHRRKKQFDTVTASMSEGLVLLDSQGIILSMNPAAAHLLDVRSSCIGREFITVNRNLSVTRLIETAMQGSRAETTVQLTAGEYQVDASPVKSDGDVSGVVLLLFDVTDRQKAEAIRREFTANVSHELKTPLHSISGYAELLNSGMVQPGDVPQFTEKIYTEAQRLIRLVEDIIRLSRLDEGSENTKQETVDLYVLAQEVIRSLSAEAALANVTVSLTGENTTVSGTPHLLSGILTNLCDNAIKYNRTGGTVTVTVGRSNEGPFLSVADTGIGIPPEHHDRIFERFYRVDKSHSKEVGGTGLGLSIVKHAALILGARIGLDSTPGKGTAITVQFPQ